MVIGTGFLLFIVSVFLSVILYSIAIPYSIISYLVRFRFVKAMRYIDNMLFMMAYSIDKLGNVVLGPIMNDALLVSRDFCPIQNPVLDKDIVYEIVDDKRKVVRFGNPNQTISEVLGYNINIANIKKGWMFIPKTLDYFDENHCLKSVKKNQLYTPPPRTPEL